MRISKNKMMWPALALSFLLAFPVLLSNNAYSHGDAPSTCENRYDADIASMAIDNGTRTFDPVSDSDLEFDAQISDGYDVTFTLHTANASSQNNTLAGTTWYRNTAFGFGSGVCVDDAGPGQDIQLTVHVDPVSGIPDGYAQNVVEWGSWPETVQITYKVVWHNATDSNPPVEEQPPQQNDTQSVPEPPPEEQTQDTPDDDAEEEEEPEDEPAGTIFSPFIFNNDADSTSESTATSSIEEQQEENVDVLEINGTLASFHFLNGMQLYILSGNWSMAMNDTAVFDFSANFTTVRANGLDRQTYSLDNLTAVSDSDLSLANGTMALTSALDFANGTTTRVNATITLVKLNVIQIELDSLSTPIYGVVDKVMRTENGETLEMVRQFDMI